MKYSEENLRIIKSQERLNKKILLVTLLFVFMIVSSSGVLGAECLADLSNAPCTVATGNNLTLVPNTYTLGGGPTLGVITMSSAGNNIIDGNGSTLIGNGSGIGLLTNTGSNITVKNFNLITNYTDAIRIDSGEVTNITVKNVTITNSSNNINIRFFANGNLSNFMVSHSTFNTSGPLRFNLGGNNKIFNWTIENNNFSTNSASTIIQFGADILNLTINNNIFTGPSLLFSTGIDTNVPVITNFNLTNNAFRYFQQGIILKGNSSNNYIANNLFKESDTGIFLINNSNTNTDIFNNTFFNITTDEDNFDLSLRSINSSNYRIRYNNFSYFGSTAIWLQSSNNINITNNTFEGIPFSERSNFLADDFFDPYGAIKLNVVYKSWVTAGRESDFRGNLSDMNLLVSNNIIIQDNTFDSNVQILLMEQGAENITHDLTDYWFKSYQFPDYLIGRTKIYIQNSFSNISRFRTSQSNDFRQGYAGVYHTNVSFFNNQYDFYKNINTTTSAGLNLYNLTNALIYNTNGSVLGSTTINNNDGNVNITLPPNNSSFVLDNYKANESESRANNPISISGTDTIKTVTSTLTDTVQVTTILETQHCQVGLVVQTFPNGTTQPFNNPTCNNNLITIEPSLPTGASIFTISTCTGNERTWYPIILLFATLGLLTLTFIFIKGSNNTFLEGATLNKVIIAFIGLSVGIALLTIIGDLIIARCPI